MIENNINKSILESKVYQNPSINLDKLLKFINLEDKETVLFNDEIIKTNKNNKKQKRLFILTNNYLYNLGSINFIFFKKLFNQVVKRKILVKNIDYIIYTYITNTFILKISLEYDYWLNYDNFDNLLLNIYKNNKNLKLWYTDESDIKKYLQRENEVNQLYIDDRLDYFDPKSYELIKIKFKSINYLKKRIIFLSKEKLNYKNFQNIKIIGKLSKNLYKIIFYDIIFLTSIIKESKFNDLKININCKILLKYNYIFKFKGLIFTLTQVDKYDKFIDIKKNTELNENLNLTLLFNLIDLYNYFYKNNIFYYYIFDFNQFYLDSENGFKIANYFNLIKNFNNKNKIDIIKKNNLQNICLYIFQIFISNAKMDINDKKLDKYILINILKEIIKSIEKKLSYDEILNNSLYINTRSSFFKK